jgi:dCTP deaminase
MIVNMEDLLNARPIVGMLSHKVMEHGVSYGLSEAGYDIRVQQRISFGRDQRFVLASSVEEFIMPRDLVGIVHDKSTWARQGLSVFNTVIEPGWRGFLTLELVYHGRHHNDLEIPAGAGIAQVIFHKTTRDAAYNGKYQGQPDRPVGAIAS